MNAGSVVRELRGELAAAGLSGSFLVRDLDSGAEASIDADAQYPVASVVKVPLAVAVQERVARGELDPAQRLEVQPEASVGPTGLSRFRFPAVVAVDDLVYLSLCLSDNSATEALFGLVPPEEVAAELQRLGVAGFSVRHGIRDVGETPAHRLGPQYAHLGVAMAIGAQTEGRGSRVRQLDVTLANAASARACADLLEALWRPSKAAPEAAARVRDLMGANMLRQRLAPDFESDASAWSSKTGTVLNLRHEMGVVDHAGGGSLAVVALTESRVAAVHQPAAEAVIGRVARELHDLVRGG